MNLRFYYCDICKKTVAVVTDTGTPTHCCGQPMRELIPNRTDGALEKHVPVYSVAGSMVSAQVGSVLHPMTEKHSIVWIGLRTAKGFQMRELKSGDNPEADFFLESDDRAEAVYAFCNLHGLWIAEIHD